MENLAVQLLLGALIGGFLGNLRSRHLVTDLLILGIWAVIFFMDPSHLIGAAIGGYLLGWGWRCHRASKVKSTDAESGDDSNSDNIY